MKRLSLIAVLASLLAAAVFAYHPSASHAVEPAQCIGKQSSPACGGSTCNYTGTLPAGWHMNVCWGYWRYAIISTTGCCYAGYSNTGFWYNWRDTRLNNVSGLQINSQHPELGQYFYLHNDSALGVWYYVTLYA